MNDKYINELIETLEHTRIYIENSKELTYEPGIQALVECFTRHKRADAQVYFMGNGGSSAIASHMTADFMKNGGMKTYSLYDNAVTTCMGNDYGYEYIFSRPMEFLVREGDLIVVISSSGNSANIINAVKVAKSKNAYVITFTGFKPDNRARQLGDINVHVPCEKYGIVESIHNLILQQVVDMILLDWDIQGQDGIQTARMLSDRFGSELPIILLIDGEWDEFEKDAESVGIHSYISKPLFRSALYYSLRPFTEELPQTEKLQQTPENKSETDLNGKRILVAEDNELNWEIAHEILLVYGLETEWAENGQICVSKFEKSPPGWYDAILMDLRMPVMTGYEAASAIRRSKREDAQTIPIIAVSANAFEEDIRKCLDCGMNAHTAKPFDTKKILSLLKEYLQ